MKCPDGGQECGNMMQCHINGRPLQSCLDAAEQREREERDSAFANDHRRAYVLLHEPYDRDSKITVMRVYTDEDRAIQDRDLFKIADPNGILGGHFRVIALPLIEGKP